MAKKKANRNSQSSRNSPSSTAGSSPPVVPPTDPPEPTGAPEPDPNESGLTYDVYLRERDKLIDIENKSSDLHDKAILQLTMASLGVSATFLDRIAPNPVPCTLVVLCLSWIALVMSIFSIMASFLLSQKACRFQRELLDLEFTSQRIPPQTNRFSDWTVWSSLAAYALFVIGISLLLLFSAINLFLAERGSISAAPVAQESLAKEPGR